MTRSTINDPAGNEARPAAGGPVPISLKGTDISSGNSGRGRLHLVKSGRFRAKLNFLAPGFTESLHMHSGIDGFWLVMSGSVLFYGEGDELIGDFAEGEGVVVPRGNWYSFEAGPDGAELLQVLALGDDEKWDRRNFEQQEESRPVNANPG